MVVRGAPGGPCRHQRGWRLHRWLSCLRDWTLPGGLAKTFCRESGSDLFARVPQATEISIVRMAPIDGDPGVGPSAHRFVAYAAPWEDVHDDGLPRFDERRRTVARPPPTHIETSADRSPYTLISTA
jgi:hypothetical protein